MEIQTHEALDRALCGNPSLIAPGRAEVILETTGAMAADDRGLVHGGFLFGAADHAAMLAVNHPNVVLGKAEVRFLGPVVAGERVVAVARLVEAGRPDRPEVEVEASVDGRPVLAGRMLCAVPERHVLDRAGAAAAREGRQS